MKNETEIKYCRNKKCRKPLPAGYRHKYCEACRNQHAQIAKNIGKDILAAAGSVASVAVAIITVGKINPKK